MKKTSCLIILPLVALFVMVFGQTASAVTTTTNTTYYIDYAGGSDTNAGTSTTTPWKHIPGDTAAASVPLGIALGQGDKVIFKGGVEYPGNYLLKWSGVSGNPIVFDGNTAGTFGTGQAIFSGADHVSGWVRCTSQADAGGSPLWADCFALTLPADCTPIEPWQVNLFYDGNRAVVARYPKATDPIWFDDLTTFAVSSSHNTTSIDIPTGAGFPTTTDWSGAWAGNWEGSNRVQMRAVTSTTNGGLTVNFSIANTPEGTGNTFALFNHPLLLGVRGEYVLTNSNTRLIFYAGSGGAAPVSTLVSARGDGITLAGQSYYTFQNIIFENFAGNSVDGRKGAGIITYLGYAQNPVGITLEKCDFIDNTSLYEVAAISMTQVTTLVVDNCVIKENFAQRGVAIGNGIGNTTFTNNVLDRNGGTGVWFNANPTTLAQNNVITNHMGIHANGMSFYTGSTNATVTGNIIEGGKAAITVQSSQNLDFSYNVLTSNVVGDVYTFAIWSSGSDPASENITVRNNTIQNYGGTPYYSFDCADALMNSNTALFNLQVYNNIMDGSVVLKNQCTLCENNLYTHLSSFQGGSYVLEPGAINATGKTVYVSRSLQDYHLVPGSLAIDAGVSWGQTGDIDNSPIWDAPDIGAYEYQKIVSLAGGSQHSLGLKADGTVWTWGTNTYGQLGNGTTTSTTAGAKLTSLSGMTAIATGQYFSMALKSDGTVWAWGRGDQGELGNGTTTQSTTPVQVSGLTGIEAIACGSNFSMAVKSDGTLWAWGYGGLGQLGVGTGATHTTPVQVTTLTGIADVAAGSGHTVAVTTSGTVYAWGYNTTGQLGDGTTTNRNLPVPVSAVSNVVSVACGGSHTMAVTSSGLLYTWGSNSNGQLGDGTTTTRTSPILNTTVSNVAQAAGGSVYSKILTKTGTVWDWGSNAQGQLGDGTMTDKWTPFQVTSLSSILYIASGYYDGLQVKSDGTVWDVGYNIYGQLGDSTTITKTTPVQATGLNLN